MSGWPQLLAGLIALACCQALSAADFIAGNGFEAGCDADRDGDRLPDCVETADGRFLSPLATGTRPELADSDRDGIDDGDEVHGSLGGLDLPALGANPNRRNLYLELDWVDDEADCGPHSHRPSLAVVSQLEQYFATLPIANPDGSQGIDLRIDIGQGGLLQGGNQVPDFDGILLGGLSPGSEYWTLKAQHFDARRAGYFRYGILAHRYGTVNNQSSGEAETPGDDLIVSLQCLGSETFVRNTVLHELGHNLGLRHGGAQDCNDKPNYNSVMNYRFHFAGTDHNCELPGDGGFGYSGGLRPALNEAALDEAAGICGLAAGRAQDWNGDGDISAPVSANINPAESQQIPRCGAVLSWLPDHNDIQALDLGALSAGSRSEARRSQCPGVAERAW